MEINEILKLAVDKGASDVHLVVGNPPMMRDNMVVVPNFK